MKIDHIGIAVRAFGEATKSYEETFGLKVSSVDQVEEQGVRLAMLDIGESRLELLEPTRDDSPIGKFLSKRGEGLHHIAIQVENLELLLTRLKAAGVRLIDEKPRNGAHNTKVAFIHPSSTHGVLMELVQHGE